MLHPSRRKYLRLECNIDGQCESGLVGVITDQRLTRAAAVRACIRFATDPQQRVAFEAWLQTVSDV